jgi:alanine or glycine:cation symporter, AGCS family
MKKTLLSLIVFLCGAFGAFAQEKGLDERINDMVKPATTAIESVVFYSIPLSENTSMPVVVLILLLAASFFTIYFRFVNITHFKLALNTVRGKYSSKEHIGEVSHFQALSAALSGTVGLGNIAGVAIAVSIGGPGATFWMILAGLLGMSSKFVECTLGVKFRDVGPDGTVYGGPMYYLSKGLRERNMGKFGKVLAAFFAVMCVGGSFGGGNMFQANQAAAQFNSMVQTGSGYAGFAFGVILAALVAIVIIGGIKRIGAVAERIVPFMCGVYVLAALVILALNLDHIPGALSQIIGGAFAPISIAGGFVGVLVQGFRRAAFSNEAGIGSAAIAHSAVRTDYAASEGIVALLEPFIDTVVICTMTALVIVITNFDGGIMVYGTQASDGVAATSRAFATVLPWFPYVLTIAVILFAFSTMLSWSYYGLQAWMYLFGRNKVTDFSYKVLFCIFVVVGASASLGAVVDFSDAMIFAMAVPNLIGLFFLLPVVKTELAKYVTMVKNL